MDCEIVATSNRTSAGLASITAETVLQAMHSVTSGVVIDLGHDLSESIPMGPEGEMSSFDFTWRVTPEGSGRGRHYQYSAETISGSLHVGTHIDGLAHVSASGRAYGGTAVSEIRTDRGFSQFGIETVPPIVTRGTVLDVAALHGVDALDDGFSIGVDDLRECLERAHLDIREGDAILVKTGKGRQFGVDNVAYQSAQPGVGPEAAIWLYEQGMSVLGTDTTGTEPLPFADETFTTHQEMLVERGVHLIENLNLTGVGNGGNLSGLFVCLPLRIVGATGSWVRPILVV